MKKILLACLFLLFALPVAAAELLMFSNSKCSFCQAFLKEVAPTYANTEYSKLLPLKVIQINEPMAAWIKKAFEDKQLQSIIATPTFVIWDGKEIARVEGYAGKESFYEAIAVFVEENKSITVKKPKGSHGPMDEFGSARVPPEGVINSRDLFQHMYQTAEEALKASEWFGCHGNIHFHKDENVWMPCSMN